MTHSHTTEQRAIHSALRSSTSNLMISARAGSAKTYTVIESGCALLPRRSTLVCVFNKRNAEEAKTKVPSHVIVKTMNGIGHTAWMRALGSQRITLKSNKLFFIMKELTPEWGLEQDEFGDWLNLVQKARSKGYVPEGEPLASRRSSDFRDQWDRNFWQDLCYECDFDFTPLVKARVNQALLVSIKQAYQGIIDFDDQIYMSVLFGGQFPKYDIVIVDEAQDLSTMNHIMVERSLAPGGRLIVVGDPYQSIYAFRGAASNSMDLFASRFEFEQLKLTQSFRAPHSVAERQTGWVEDFRAAEGNRPGSVEHWDKWSISQLPLGPSSAVLCRNNGPLFRLAIKLLSNRIPCTILGNDIAKSLERLLVKISGGQNLAANTMLLAIESWARTEADKVKDSKNKVAGIYDRAECLSAIVTADGVKDRDSAVRVLAEMFEDKTAAILLSSIHRSKGMEWNHVVILDSWLINKRADDPESEDYRQEENLRYVGETRTRDTLVLADSKNCEELQRDEDA